MAGLARLAAIAATAAALTACASGGGTPGTGSTTELKTASDTTAAEKRAAIRLQLAVGYFQDRKYEIALDEIKQALVADPKAANAYGLRGLVYGAMGETALADTNFKEALALEPNNPDLQNNYGSFLCQNNRAEQGLALFDRALANRSYGTPVSALVNAGNCSLRLKRNDLAERYFTEGLQYAPDLAPLNAGLARVYFERRDMERAGFFINRLLGAQKLDRLSPDVLWLAIRIERKLGQRDTESSLVAQLRKQFPGSPEYAAFQRGAFDE
ncbi:MAG: type IV pilus biogenesis/stability protein PilW [Telluria sp.]